MRIAAEDTESGDYTRVMKDHFTADWAFGITGAIENSVRRNFPQDLRNWPLIGAFNFEAYELPNEYMVFIFKDELSGIPAEPGVPKPFPFSDHPALPPKLDELELWQFYLKDKFDLREEDAAFLIPVRDSGKHGALEDYELFSPEEKMFWNAQISYVLRDIKPTYNRLMKTSHGNPRPSPTLPVGPTPA